MVEKGEVQVKVLMFPLAMHKGAREQCIAVVCDKKSFEDLESGYTSESKCAEGEKLVDETVALLSAKGITGTPTYIFADGKFKSGVLEANALRLQLGLPVPPPSPGAPAGPAAPAAPPVKKEPPAAPKK